MPWLMATIYDRIMRRSEALCLNQWRADLLHDLRGAVLEVGAGTGVNLAHYPPTVSRLVLVEPDRHMRQRLELRCRSTGLSDVEIWPDPLEELRVPPASFDAVVATLVLCSVPDLPTTLQQIVDLLRPGGRLVFLEHVAAEGNPRRLRWQGRLEPLWRRVAGNCHLTRRTEGAILRTGLLMERIERASIRKAPPFVRPSIRGIARKPGPEAA